MYEPVTAPVATIVITTKNRKDDLRNAVASSLLQHGQIEILVVDDGSSDGTSEMVRSEFPSVRVIRQSKSTGYIVARNEAARNAAGAIIFSIDDDAVFTSPKIILQTIVEFSDQRIGAIAIPYADVNRDGVERQRSPCSNSIYLTDRFIGTAHAIRKDVFLEIGGYRQCFFHQGEESDFCIRMLNKGYFVRLGGSQVIHHFESPKRDTKRMDLYGRRNDILFAVLNVPWPWFPLHLLAVTLRGLWFGVCVGRPLRMLHGVLWGYFSAGGDWAERNPVSGRTYRLYRRLRKAGAVKACDIWPFE
jgi:GT2 family glycosyltransferase